MRPSSDRVCAPPRGLASAAALIYTAVAQAGSAATFTVGVTVLPHVALRAASTPAALSISAQDVRRGYVDAPEPTRLVVSSNDPRGFAIEVWPASEVFAAISVRGTGASVTLGRAGGTIVQRALRGGALPVTLTWRFMLAAGIAPGLYPWPLQYAVRPLGPDQ